MQHLPIHPTLLHPLTGLPLQAVGVVGGRTIWPIMGASEDSADANDDAPSDGDGDDGGGSDDDAGDGADNKLEQARQEAIARRQELKPWKSLGREFGMTPDQVREALTKVNQPPKGGTDDAGQQVDADAIRREAERDAAAKANTRIVKSEVKAAAANLFADPADAPLYVDLTKFEVDDDGEVDADEIKRELDAVIKAKPHLAKSSKGPKPDRSQGPRGNTKADPGPGVARLRQAYADSAK